MLKCFSYARSVIMFNCNGNQAILEICFHYSSSIRLDQERTNNGKSAVKQINRHIQKKKSVKDAENRGYDDHLEEISQSSMQIELDLSNNQR